MTTFFRFAWKEFITKLGWRKVAALTPNGERYNYPVIPPVPTSAPLPFPSSSSSPSFSSSPSPFLFLSLSLYLPLSLSLALSPAPANTPRYGDYISELAGTLEENSIQFLVNRKFREGAADLTLVRK